nr:MAG TPA: Putative TetR-family transcriptional regulator [Caudoviricetes sp.]
MRCIEGKSFKEIAIECGLSRRTMCNIAKRIAEKMHKFFVKHEHYFH